jgi:hypothetical protein
MKIKSKFKDYYDYVQWINGGGDPKIIYDRPPLLFEKETHYIPNELKNEISLNFREPLNCNTWSHAHLVVCGKVYLLSRKWQNQEEEANGRIPDVDDRYIGYSLKGIDKLSTFLKQPIFLVWSVGNAHHGPYVKVDRSYPILGKTRLPSFYEATQLYQDLAYWLSSVMKTAPDVMPATNTTDKEKIVAHGFDLKTSFRKQKTAE